jgi:hypothetical protein
MASPKGPSNNRFTIYNRPAEMDKPTTKTPTYQRCNKHQPFFNKPTQQPKAIQCSKPNNTSKPTFHNKPAEQGSSKQA